MHFVAAGQGSRQGVQERMFCRVVLTSACVLRIADLPLNPPYLLVSG
jgi:hypothetical protein